MSGPQRIPLQHTLPGGYTIRVRIIPAATMLRRFGPCIACWVERGAGGTVYLQKERGYAEQWSDWTHEVLHLAADYENWVQNHIVLPVVVAVGQQYIEEDED